MSADIRPAAAGAKIRVFKNRNFALLFWGIAVSNIAHVFFSFAIGFYIYEITIPLFGASDAEIIKAVFIALSGILIVILSPIGGGLADRWNKAKIMYVTDFIRGLTILAVGAIVFLVESNVFKLIALFVMEFVLAANAAIFMPAARSLLRFIVSDEELQPGASYLQMSDNFQAIIGLVFAAMLYAKIGVGWIFIINGIAYVFSAVSEMFIRYEHKQSVDETLDLKTVFSDIKVGFKYLISEKAIVAIMVMALMINFFVSPIFSNGMQNWVYFRFAEESTYLFSSFMDRTSWYGAFSISLSIASILMSLVLARQKTKASYAKPLKRALTGFVISMSGLCALLVFYYYGFVPINAVLIGGIILMFICGLGLVAFNIPLSMVMQRKVRKDMLGKVSAVSGTLSQALIPVAAVIAGFVIARAGTAIFFIGSAVGMIAVMMWFLPNKASNQI
ncbi:MAG TPA: hypothetical protein DCR44_03365 [Acholeplasmatales bacterium]|nr:hypothetical protein [Acholeplasmatales bacterium]